MIYINRCQILGTVGKDPENKSSVAGLVSFFTVATNRKFYSPNGDPCFETCWHKVVCFGKTAEIARKAVKSGDAIFVDGHISNREYTDATGAKRVSNELIADHIYVVSSTERVPTEAPVRLPDVAMPKWNRDEDRPF